MLGANFQGETLGDHALAIFDGAVDIALSDVTAHLLLDVELLLFLNSQALKAVECAGSLILNALLQGKSCDHALSIVDGAVDIALSNVTSEVLCHENFLLLLNGQTLKAVKSTGSFLLKAVL